MRACGYFLGLARDSLLVPPSFTRLEKIRNTANLTSTGYPANAVGRFFDHPEFGPLSKFLSALAGALPYELKALQPKDNVFGPRGNRNV